MPTPASPDSSTILLPSFPDAPTPSDARDLVCFGVPPDHLGRRAPVGVLHGSWRSCTAARWPSFLAGVGATGVSGRSRWPRRDGGSRCADRGLHGRRPAPARIRLLRTSISLLTNMLLSNISGLLGLLGGCSGDSSSGGRPAHRADDLAQAGGHQISRPTTQVPATRGTPGGRRGGTWLGASMHERGRPGACRRSAAPMSSRPRARARRRRWPRGRPRRASSPSRARRGPRRSGIEEVYDEPGLQSLASATRTPASRSRRASGRAGGWRTPPPAAGSPPCRCRARASTSASSRWVQWSTATSAQLDRQAYAGPGPSWLACSAGREPGRPRRRPGRSRAWSSSKAPALAEDVDPAGVAGAAARASGRSTRSTYSSRGRARPGPRARRGRWSRR